jgi:hypothetical protein
MITADGGADDDDLLDEEMAELEDMILNLQE